MGTSRERGEKSQKILLLRGHVLGGEGQPATRVAFKGRKNMTSLKGGKDAMNREFERWWGDFGDGRRQRRGGSKERGAQQRGSVLVTYVDRGGES